MGRFSDSLIRTSHWLGDKFPRLRPYLPGWEELRVTIRESRPTVKAKLDDNVDEWKEFERKFARGKQVYVFGRFDPPDEYDSVIGPALDVYESTAVGEEGPKNETVILSTYEEFVEHFGEPGEFTENSPVNMIAKAMIEGQRCEVIKSWDQGDEPSRGMISVYRQTGVDEHELIGTLEPVFDGAWKDEDDDNETE